MSQTIGRVWTFYYLWFEIKYSCTILEVLIIKYVHQLKESVVKMCWKYGVMLNFYDCVKAIASEAINKLHLLEAYISAEVKTPVDPWTYEYQSN